LSFFFQVGIRDALVSTSLRMNISITGISEVVLKSHVVY
jgi:hypothetical protein